MDHIGPYSFNVFRFLLGALSLVPLVYFLRRKDRTIKKWKPFWIIGGWPVSSSSAEPPSSKSVFYPLRERPASSPGSTS